MKICVLALLCIMQGNAFTFSIMKQFDFRERLKSSFIGDWQPYDKPIEKFPDVENFVPKVKYDEQELMNRLTEAQFFVTMRHASEYPGTGKQLWNKRPGIYNCVVCDKNLFNSEDKYRLEKDADPHEYSGYMTFKEKSENVVIYQTQSTNRLIRQTFCENCGSYIGEMFKEGEGRHEKRRYSVNSGSVNFLPRKEVTE